VKKRWLLFLTLLSSISLGLVFWVSLTKKPLPKSSLASVPLQKSIRYEAYTLSSSVVHVLWIPAGQSFSVTPALSDSLESLESFAQKHHAIAVLNAGFFDPDNHQSTAFVVQQGRLVADPRLNKRLMQNPRLAPYLNKILNRTEFRQYFCGSTVRYEFARHQDPPSIGCRLVSAVGGGPRLLPELTLTQEGFLDISQGKVVRDPLSSSQPNARTAIGITQDNTVVWVMVAQKPEAPNNSGMSLTALAAFLKTLGVKEAMNLDGGSSSSFYYKGETFYGKMNAQGNPVKRSLKSVLLLKE